MSAPHFYSTDRYCMVLSGTWWCNSGADFDPASCVPVHAGSYVRRVALTPHYDGVIRGHNEPAVIAICGIGPTNFKLNDPQSRRGGKCERQRERQPSHWEMIRSEKLRQEVTEVNFARTPSGPAIWIAVEGGGNWRMRCRQPPHGVGRELRRRPRREFRRCIAPQRAPWRRSRPLPAQDPTDRPRSRRCSRKRPRRLACAAPIRP